MIVVDRDTMDSLPDDLLPLFVCDPDTLAAVLRVCARFCRVLGRGGPFVLVSYPISAALMLTNDTLQFYLRECNQCIVSQCSHVTRGTIHTYRYTTEKLINNGIPKYLWDVDAGVMITGGIGWDTAEYRNKYMLIGRVPQKSNIHNLPGVAIPGDRRYAVLVWTAATLPKGGRCHILDSAEIRAYSAAVSSEHYIYHRVHPLFFTPPIPLKHKKGRTQHMLSLPVELLPQILADPACSRALAETCRSMSARVPRRAWRRTDGGVSSDYYTATYNKLSVAEFAKVWNRCELSKIETAFTYLYIDGEFLHARVIPAALGSWVLLAPPPPKYTRFFHLGQFTGPGAKKCDKELHFKNVLDDWGRRQCDAALVARQPIYCGVNIMLGSESNIFALARLVAQSCVVYLRSSGPLC